MREIILSACALVAAAGSAMAQGGNVEFRIRELTGQSVITSSADAVLDFVVEGRVTSGTRALGDWAFDIAIAGEAESNGSFARLRINNADGTYVPGISTSTTGGGVAGVALQYRYLVGLNGAFNGVFNTSSGTFVNNPAEQEIGLIAGSARGGGLANTGILVDPGDGNLIPATGSDYTTAVNTFFGANNNYVQLYRFRYTVSNLTARNLNFVLRNATAATFANLVPAGTDFSGDTTGGGAQVSASGAVVTIVPAPASVALLGLGGLAVARRRR